MGRRVVLAGGDVGGVTAGCVSVSIVAGAGGRMRQLRHDFGSSETIGAAGRPDRWLGVCPGRACGSSRDAGPGRDDRWRGARVWRGDAVVALSPVSSDLGIGSLLLLDPRARHR